MHMCIVHVHVHCALIFETDPSGEMSLSQVIISLSLVHSLPIEDTEEVLGLNGNVNVNVYFFQMRYI